MLKNEDIVYEDHYIRSILDNTKTIAMIGLSSSWQRPSYFVAKYLLDRGYKIFPVNPREAGKTILNQKVYSSVSEINENIDMVDIFRKSIDVDLIIDDLPFENALQLCKGHSQELNDEYLQLCQPKNFLQEPWHNQIAHFLLC